MALVNRSSAASRSGRVDVWRSTPPGVVAVPIEPDLKAGMAR